MSLAQAPSTDLDHAQLAAILRWYADMGVDIAIEETPQNRFLEVAKPAQAPAAVPQDEPRQARAPVAFSANANSGRSIDAAAALSVEAAVQVARESAARATTLEELRAELMAFEGCILKRSATHFIFADGEPTARIMFIADAPGDEDDRQGQPFLGPAGRLLDRMLKSIELDRKSVYLSNLVPWRPPTGRKLLPQEVAVCLPFVMRQIALVQPAILVCLGDDAAQTLMGLKGSVIRSRGVWQELRPEGSDHAMRAIATLAPGYLLRAAASKRMVWRDLIEIRKALDAVV